MGNGQVTPTRPDKLLKQLETIEKIMDHKTKDKISQKKESPAKSGKNERGSEKCRSNDGPGNSPRVPKNRRQRNSVIAARIREGDSKPTTPTIVQNTKPTELLKRVTDPSRPRAETLRVERVNPRRNGEETNKRSHISLQHLIRSKSR